MLDRVGAPTSRGAGGNSGRVFLAGIRDIQCHDYGGFRFVHEAWAIRHGMAGRLVQFTLARGNQGEALTDPVDGRVGERVTMSGLGERVLGDVGQDPPS
jgi:hypothetical protein